MTKLVKKITIIAASLLLTFNTMSFGFNDSQDIKASEIIIVCGNNGEDIPIIY